MAGWKISHEKINLFVFGGVALLLLSLPFLHILFDSERVLTYRDLLQTFLPAKHFWMTTVKEEGTLPTWNPYMFSGTPFFADFKSSVLYPLNFVFLLFDQNNFFNAFSWYIFLHFPIMALGMFLFLKNSGICKQASIVFSLVYALSGVSISTMNMCNLLAVQCMLPFFANFVRNWTNHLGPFLSVNTFGLIFCLALPIYSGIPEFSYFFSLYFVISLIRRFDSRYLRSFLMIGGSALIVSAAQLMPGLESLMLSKRGLANISISQSQLYVFHPTGFVKFFLQMPFGNYVPDNTYWGYIFNDSNKMESPFFFSYYVGGGLFLGLIGYLFSFKRAFLFHTIFAVILLILASGRHFFIDFSALFSNYFPLWKVSRYPEKLIIPFSFFLVFSQAIGWQWVLDRLKDKRKTVLLIGSWLILCGLSYFLVQRMVPVGGYSIPNDSWRLFLLVSLLQGTVLLAVRYSLNLWNYRWYLLLFVFATDSGIHARSMIWDQPAALFDSLFANKIKSDLLDRSREIRAGAAFRYSLQMAKPELMLIPDDFDVVSISTVTKTKILFQGVPGLYKIHDIFGRGVLPNAENKSLWEELIRVNIAKGLNILGAYYIGTDSKIDGSAKLIIVTNKDAVPYVFIPGNIHHIADSTNIVNRLTSKEFNEQEEVLIESGKNSRIENNRVKSVEILRKKSSSIKIKVMRDQREETACLVLNESMNPHWRAYVNDEPTPIYRANGWSMAINLKRSCGADCLVEFRYENNLIQWGSLISLSFVLISLSLFVFRKCRH